MTQIYWIETPTPGRLAIMPRPRGGDWLQDEVAGWSKAGVNVVVSLMTPDEVANFDLSREISLSNAAGIEFVEFPIVDRGIPASREAAVELTIELARRLVDGKNVAIHCRQGLGRAPLLAIAILVQAGLDFPTAKEHVRQARGCPVPETREQDAWLATFSNELLARSHP
jgi:protein-tyrosine phosphatase